MTLLKNKIATVGFLGILIAYSAAFSQMAFASETTGTLSSSMSDGSSGSIAGTVTGGTPAAGSNSSGGGGGPLASFGGGGGGGVAYGGGSVIPAYPGAPAAGGPYPAPEDYSFAYTSYPSYSSGSSAGSGSGSGSAAGDETPGVPDTGPIATTLSPGQSLMAASVQSGGMSTAAAIAAAVAGIAILGGAAYGINSYYRGRRGL
jgi:hypothetical protein